MSKSHHPPARQGQRMTSATEGSERRNLYCTSLVILVGVLAYLNSFHGVFLLDDQVNIVGNPHLAHPTFDWQALNYRRRPVVNLSLMLNYACGQLNVWGYHALNVSIHLLAGLTLFGLVRRTLLRSKRQRRIGKEDSPTARRKPLPPSRTAPINTAAIIQPTSVGSGSVEGLALVVALIWMVHPLQTQSVTYIVQRSESLMGLFYLLTIYSVARGADSPRPFFFYAVAVLACALGMGTKAVMLTAPVVTLLYDRVFLARSFSQALRKRFVLYIGLVGTWGVLIATGVVQGVLFPSANATSHVGFGFTKIAPMQYALTQTGVIMHYLKLSLWPSPLCLDYDWPVADNIVAVLPAVMAVTSLLIATLWALFRRPWLGFVGAWFFLILAPTSSIIPIKDVAFEHRMYLPLAAVVALVVIASHAALNRLAARISMPDRVRRNTKIGLVAAVVVLLILMTVHRNQDYVSRLTMWTNVVQQRPRNARAHLNLGIALAGLNRLDEAVAHYKQSLKIDPDYVLAHYNLGVALSKQHRFADAIQEYRQTIELDPAHVQARGNLGQALASIGRLDQAIDEFRLALRYDPDNLTACFNLGSALAKMGRLDDALKQFHQAAKISPNRADVRYVLGTTLLKLGKVDDAIRELRAASSIQPHNAEIRRTLRTALTARNKPTAR